MELRNQLQNFIKYAQKEKVDEKTIVNFLSGIIESNLDDKDVYYEVNNALYQNGYSFRFEYIPKKEYLIEFDHIEYRKKVNQVTKSNKKTLELAKYLWEHNNWRLSLFSLQFLKIARLISIKALPDIEALRNIDFLSVYDAYMSCLSNYVLFDNYEIVKKELEKFMEYIGIRDANEEYMRFRLDLEYLLWTIKDKNFDADYKKINTIRIGFSLLPIQYINWYEGNDKYYNPNIHKVIVKYLQQIHQKEKQRIIKKYESFVDELDNTGYKLLFNML